MVFVSVFVIDVLIVCKMFCVILLCGECGCCEMFCVNYLVFVFEFVDVVDGWVLLDDDIV